ncbi:hypothetical protein M422DRAFT_265015 [Sphaerobolus stellatus SS14]|uniref:Uncharacterized protein n=1 Tax=Sphaerobolus stellatus (strain SS14) TaxID=990650 RepID=A0A0C9V6P1_SPHS4|nr:hypothetical protein M422DRAFT_265015 [Sphaerobolus stellatus SS14]
MKSFSPHSKIEEDDTGETNGVDEAGPSNPDVLDNNSVYHEDILTSDEISCEQQRQEARSKARKCYTPPFQPLISPPRTRLRHRKRSDKSTKLPSSQHTLSQSWIIRNARPKGNKGPHRSGNFHTFLLDTITLHNYS